MLCTRLPCEQFIKPSQECRNKLAYDTRLWYTRMPLWSVTLHFRWCVIKAFCAVSNCNQRNIDWNFLCSTCLAQAFLPFSSPPSSPPFSPPLLPTSSPSSSSGRTESVDRAPGSYFRAQVGSGG